jgi:precorrin-8X/cobalt-precorrin-8 methylmutase
MKPLIHELLANPLSGDQIESRSMAIIDREAPPHTFTAEQWPVVRRMVHTTADFSLLGQVRFSPDAVDAAIRALRAGAPIYADSNMIRAGLSMARLQRVCPDYRAESILCHVADADVADEARRASLPRSLFAVRKAAGKLQGGIAVFGNAPVALLELNRLVLETGLRPALIIGMPVGFVHVVESKQELVEMSVPYITIEGRRGGSPLAVSVIHALCELAVLSAEC